MIPLSHWVGIGHTKHLQSHCQVVSFAVKSKLCTHSMFSHPSVKLVRDFLWENHARLYISTSRHERAVAFSCILAAIGYQSIQSSSAQFVASSLLALPVLVLPMLLSSMLLPLLHCFSFALAILVHDGLELRPQRLDRRELVADLPIVSHQLSTPHERSKGAWE